MKSFLFIFLFCISAWAANETCEYEFTRGQVLHKGVLTVVENTSGNFDLTLTTLSPKQSEHSGEGIFEEARGDDLDEIIGYCYVIEKQSGKEFCKDIKRATSIAEDTPEGVGILHFLGENDAILARYIMAPEWFPSFVICRN